MEIKQVIVHELLKEAKKDFNYAKPYHLRTSPLDRTNPIVIKLIKEVSNLYGTKGNSAHYGVFKEDPTEQGPIPSKFENYSLDENKSVAEFVPFSVDVMKQLVKKAKEEPWSSGGFIVFCDYSINNSRFFLISMIKKKMV